VTEDECEDLAYVMNELFDTDEDFLALEKRTW
jgi:hypothetical protein